MSDWYEFAPEQLETDHPEADGNGERQAEGQERDTDE